MNKFKEITIVTTAEQINITAIYRRDLEATNWHYYECDDGSLLHVRKEHMVYVHEKLVK
ncbi:MAG: hypothetical protein ACQESF_02675 [Nanobdellota archaeon]